ncbi:MAG TPA: hypothetical protein VGP80_12960 [Gemmatimonadales bacterium]|jgi:hypothetical protein|nr:hypothetical protein [Gemmatimonadales bacterium]
MILLLLLLQQHPLPTVGDTLWTRRTVRLAAGDSIRAADWDLDGPVQLLGHPVVVVRGSQAEISYPLVAWEPGDHQLDVPGPIITRASGTEDTLGTESVTLRVASVLPAGVPDSTLAIQPPANLVVRQEVSPLPALILGLLSVLLLVPLHWYWNRRGKPAAPSPSAPPFSPPPDMIAHWAQIGERRAVAGIAAARLRSAIAHGIPSAHPGLDTASVLRQVEQLRPQWPQAELAEVLASLDSIRFAPVATSTTNVYQLYQRGLQLAQAIERAGG